MASTAPLQLHNSGGNQILLAYRRCAQAFVQEEARLENATSRGRLRNERHRFAIWAGNLGVFANGRAAADYRLRDESNIVYVLVMLLKRLERKIRDLDAPAKETVVDTEEDTADSGSSHISSSTESSSASSNDSVSHASSSSARDSVATRLRDITSTITRLYRWSAVIKKPVSTNEAARVDKFMDKVDDEFSKELDELRSFTKWKITHMYPGLAPHIVDRLTQSIVFRRKKIIYAANHQEKLHDGLQDAFQIEDQTTDKLAPMNLILGHLDRTQPPIAATKQLRIGPRSATEATSIDKQRLGSYARSRAESKMTKHAEERLKEYDVPSAPKPLPGAAEAECPYCFAVIDRKTLEQPQWTHHVLKDLQPYVCIFDDCERPKTHFRLESEWVHHMQWEHNVAWFCPLCPHETATAHSSDEFQAHMRESHNGVYSDSQMSQLLRTSAQPQGELFLPPNEARDENAVVCPFCPFTVAEANQAKPGWHALQPKSYDQALAKTIQRHIAQHLEELSFLSLPEHSDASSADDGQETDRQDDQSNADLHSLPPPIFEDDDENDRSRQRPEEPEDFPSEYVHVDWSPYYGWEATQTSSYEGQKSDPVLQRFSARKRFGRLLSPENYTVLLVCSSVSLMDILIELLDERHTVLLPEFKHIRAINFGRTGMHNVVLAHLHTSLETSETLATLRESFPNIKYGISVGTAGGVPSAVNDIRLGDVVVSRPGGISGGVSHYRLAESKNGDSEVYGMITRILPPRAVLAAITKHSGRFYAKKRLNESYLNQLYENRPDLKIACDRSTLSDVLYEADHDHFDGASNCSQCGTSRMVLRLIHREMLEIHSGLIGAAETPMANAHARDGISKGFGTLCFDSEAAILEHDLPWTCIRGISDYADSHRNDTWQLYATVMAAVYTKELVADYLSSDDESFWSDWEPSKSGIVEINSEVALRIPAAKPEMLDDTRTVETAMREQTAIMINTKNWDQQSATESGSSAEINKLGTSDQGSKQLQTKYAESVRVLENMSAVRELTLEPHDPDLLELRQQLAAAHLKNRDNQKAIQLLENQQRIPLLEQVVSNQQLALAKGDSNLLTSQCTLAKAYKDDGEPLKAMKLYEHVVAVYEEESRRYDPEAFQSQCALAMLYHENGKKPEAIRLLEHAVAIQEATMNDGHLNFFGLQSTLADWYLSERRLDDAIALYEKNSTILNVRNDTATHNQLRNQEGLAMAYYEDEQVQYAIPILRNALRIRQTIGPEDPSTLRTMSNLATMLREEAKVDEAVELFKQVLETKRRVLGIQNLSTLQTMSDLAISLRSQNDFDGAVSLLQQVWTMKQTLRGPEHLSTVSTMMDMAITLRKGSRYEETLNLLQQILETRQRILGPEDPLTLDTIHELATTLAKHSRVDEAQRMFEYVLEARHRVLGPGHQETLDTRHGLAAILAKQSKLDEAATMYRQILESERQVLGHEHRKTLNTMRDLAAILAKQSKLDEAQSMSEQILEAKRRDLRQGYPSSRSRMTAMMNMVIKQQMSEQDEHQYGGVGEAEQRNRDP